MTHGPLERPMVPGLRKPDPCFISHCFLRNIQKYDAGDYKVWIRYRNLSSEAVLNLKFNPEKELQAMVTILTSFLAILLVALFCFIVVWWNRIQILLFIRRHWGKYDQGQMCVKLKSNLNKIK